jgi:hypothetical protein
MERKRSPFEAAGRQISEERRHASRRATDLVERTADAHVQGETVQLAQKNIADGIGGAVQDAFERRLLDLYVGEEEGRRAVVRSAWGHRVRELPVAIQKEAISNVTWAPWLEAYRRTLDTLVEPLGLPGVFSLLISEAYSRDL